MKYVWLTCISENVDWTLRSQLECFCRMVILPTPDCYTKQPTKSTNTSTNIPQSFFFKAVHATVHRHEAFTLMCSLLVLLLEQFVVRIQVHYFYSSRNIVFVCYLCAVYYQRTAVLHVQQQLMCWWVLTPRASELMVHLTSAFKGDHQLSYK